MSKPVRVIVYVKVGGSSVEYDHYVSDDHTASWRDTSWEAIAKELEAMFDDSKRAMARSREASSDG